MAERAIDLRTFLLETADLLDLVIRCQAVLFPAGFRQYLSEAVASTTERLRSEAERIAWRDVRQSPAMVVAGLTGSQLSLKLESFDSALIVFESDGGTKELEEALDKAGIILGSIAGAIPGFGSFAQELIDFILKELRKRLWRRSR